MGLRGIIHLAEDVIILRIYLEQLQIGKLNLVLHLAVLIVSHILIELVYLVLNIKDGGLVVISGKNFNFGLTQLKSIICILTCYFVTNFGSFHGGLVTKLPLDKLEGAPFMSCELL